MLGFLLHHGWHVLGIVPALALAFCLLGGWSVAGPFLARRPWIVAVLVAMLAAYAQQWRIVALKHEVETAAARRAEAEQAAATAKVERDAVVKAAHDAEVEAKGREAALRDMFTSQDKHTADQLKKLWSQRAAIAPGCEPAIDHLARFEDQEQP